MTSLEAGLKAGATKPAFGSRLARFTEASLDHWVRLEYNHLAMTMNELTPAECAEVLARASFGSLGCALEDQPYVVPLYFVYDAGYVYALSTAGQKVEWMRRNPKICLQVNEVAGQEQWMSVLASGRYEELTGPRYADERVHARELLERRPNWWLNALAERQLKAGNELIDPLFFRMHIEHLTGLRAVR